LLKKFIVKNKFAYRSSD